MCISVHIIKAWNVAKYVRCQSSLAPRWECCNSDNLPHLRYISGWKRPCETFGLLSSLEHGWGQSYSGCSVPCQVLRPFKEGIPAAFLGRFCWCFTSSQKAGLEPHHWNILVGSKREGPGRNLRCEFVQVSLLFSFGLTVQYWSV